MEKVYSRSKLHAEKSEMSLAANNLALTNPEC
jgi:hypothetical protein